MKKLLSICIPTYNRINDLSEIIDSLLTINSSDFEIVITDNLSTDGTKEKILSYTDQRVRYCLNEEALPPFLNMIHSIFNAEGKYALYCNDRDVLYPDGIFNLMQVLEKNDFAFLYSSTYSKSVTDELNVYQSGFDSLMNFACIHHPTGMVYNREIISEHLNEETYSNYLKYINTYDFLMLDLFRYGNSACFSNRYWGTRATEYIKKNKSGTRLYFLPEVRETMFYGIVNHVFRENDYQLNCEEKKKLIRKIYLEFAFLFCKYKSCMADEDETAHYGISTKYISAIEMLKIFNGFFGRSIEYLTDNEYEEYLVEHIKNKKFIFLFEIIKKCIKIDLIYLIKKFK